MLSASITLLSPFASGENRRYFQLTKHSAVLSHYSDNLDTDQHIKDITKKLVHFSAHFLSAKPTNGSVPLYVTRRQPLLNPGDHNFHVSHCCAPERIRRKWNAAECKPTFLNDCERVCCIKFIAHALSYFHFSPSILTGQFRWPPRGQHLVILSCVSNGIFNISVLA